MITSRVLTALLILTMGINVLPAQREGSAPQREGSPPAREGSGPADAAEAKKALEGYDPVLLVQGKKQKGRSDLTATHEGFVYHFAGSANRSAFQANMEKYAVQDEGLCPVARVKMNQEVPGKPDVFSVHNEKIFLFANEDAKKMFEQNPSQFLPERPREGS